VLCGTGSKLFEFESPHTQRGKENRIAQQDTCFQQHVARCRALEDYGLECIHRPGRREEMAQSLHWWGLPGGVLELDESLPECVVREVREETGLGVAPLRLIGVYSSPDYDVSYPNGDQVQQVTFCFECRVVGGDLGGDPGKTLDLSWFAPHESPPTAPWYEAMVDDLVQGSRDASFRRGNPGARRDDLPFFQRIRRHVGRAAYVSPGAAARI